MLITTPTFRRIAAGSALALTASGAAFFASPATADSATLDYTCTFPSLGDKAVTAVHSIDVTEVQYGGTVPITSTMTVDEGTTQTLYNFLGARQVDGTADVHGIAQGAVRLIVQEAIAKQPVPATGPMTVVAKGGQSLAQYAPLTPVGSTVVVGLTDKAQDGTSEEPDIEAALNTYSVDGTKTGPLDVPCELADGQDLAVGSVTIVEADTVTEPSIGYKNKKKSVLGKVVVDAPESGVAPTGQVTLTLKKGKKTIGEPVTKMLKDGKAKASWKAAKKGTYKLIADYAGDSNFVESDGTAKKKF